jgi:TonB family protein
MTLANLLAWCIQVAVLGAAAASLPWLFRLRDSRTRLWFWQTTLVLCLVAPAVEPWVHPPPERSTVTFATGTARILPSNTAVRRPQISWTTALSALLAAGIALRLIWLGAGLLRLRRYRRSALPLEPHADDFEDLRAALAPAAHIAVSDSVTSPVTFGVRKPVVLLPATFARLGREERRSIVCHELIHIQRRDWAVAIAEELVRAAAWFHPAVWWLLGQIQLTREQVVDEAVIAHTGDSNRYLDALLAIASLRLSADLAPAPLFLKKRHLRQRVESIVSGASMTKQNMTKRNLLLPLVAALATLPVIIGVAAWQFPLRAAPQEVIDDTGVDVQLNGARVLHRTGIFFPDDARTKHLSGTVVAQVTLDEKGEVTGVQAESGPDELRKPVVQSIMFWHFALDSTTSARTLQIAVRFDGGKVSPAPPSASSTTMPRTALDTPRTIQRIDLSGLPMELRNKISEAGVLNVGDVLTREKLPAVEAALRNIDDHLQMTVMPLRLREPGDVPGAASGATSGNDRVLVAVRVNGSRGVMVMPSAPAVPQSATSAPQTIRVGGNVQSANLIEQAQPVYPPLAKQARIQGTVRFDVIIGKDGTIKNIKVDSGHPMLVQTALEAVKTWVYKPTLLNGNPVEVMTTVDVNFTLQDAPPPAAAPAQ